MGNNMSNCTLDNVKYMKEYRAAVESYADRQENYLFHNQGADHAKIIFENMFRTAKDHVRIAAESLWNDSVVNTSEYLCALCKFLDADNAKLDILLANMPSKEVIVEKEDLNLYLSLYLHPAFSEGRIRIKSGDGKTFKDSEKNVVHFTTADGRMYRLENNTLLRSATANFNDSGRTTFLEELFDEVFLRTDNDIKEIDLNEYFTI